MPHEPAASLVARRSSSAVPAGVRIDAAWPLLPACPACLQLEAAKAKLAVVTGMHVYSVQPGVPKVGACLRLCGLWAARLAACLHTTTPAGQAAMPGAQRCWLRCCAVQCAAATTAASSATLSSRSPRIVLPLLPPAGCRRPVQCRLCPDPGPLPPAHRQLSRWVGGRVHMWSVCRCTEACRRQ